MKHNFKNLSSMPFVVQFPCFKHWYNSHMVKTIFLLVLASVVWKKIHFIVETIVATLQQVLCL